MRQKTPLPTRILDGVLSLVKNGGQYNHAASWVGFARAALGDGNGAWEIFRMLDPIRKGSAEDAMANYRVEPYVIAGDVSGAPPHTGRGGWTWYTGAAAWAYRLGVEAIQNTITAVATSCTHDCADLRIADELHQLVAAALVVSGQVAAASREILPAKGREAGLLEQCASGLDPVGIHGTSGRSDPDRGARQQGPRLLQRRH